MRSSEDLVVGLMALGLVLPWIAWTVQRGLRNGRLPIGRAYVLRDERRGAFNSLLALYVAISALSVFIAVDLIFGLDVRSWL